MPRTLRRQHVDLFDQIMGRVDEAPLSELLPAVLRLASAADNTALARWARLESDGYFRGNPAMGDDITVPEYRAVTGQYYDDFGNRLTIDDPNLNFIFEDRLRFSVHELERLASRSAEIRVQRTPGIEAVRQHLNVPVTTYGFPPTAAVGVLAAIRSELLHRLADLEEDIDGLRGTTSTGSVRKGFLGWVVRHTIPILITIGTGLLIAYISHRMGWV